jgi:hypothetical protein
MLWLAIPAAACGESVTVMFPAGDCATGQLEVEVFDRASGSWRAHPSHPRLAAGRCVTEDSGTLLNELRVRCVDPRAHRAPSEWIVGAEVFRAGSAADCED